MPKAWESLTIPELIEDLAQSWDRPTGWLAWLPRRPMTEAPIVMDALIARWAEMDADARNAAWSLGGEWWTSAIERALVSVEPRARSGACQMIAGRGLGHLAGRLAAMLDDPEAMVAGAARRGLVELSRSSSIDATGREHVCTAILTAAEKYDSHRQNDVLVTLARCAQRDSAAWAASSPSAAWLADEQHPGVLVLRTLLRKSTDPVVPSAALRWLNSPTLGSAAAARLLAPLPGDSRQWLLERQHLLEDPRRQAAIALHHRVQEKPRVGINAREQPSPVTTPELLAQMTTTARTMSPRWAAIVFRDPQRLDDALASVLVDRSPVVRLAAVRQAVGRVLPPACLLDFCFDASEPIAMLAAESLLTRLRRDDLVPADRAKLGRALCASPHPRVRALARRAMQRPEVMATAKIGRGGRQARNASTMPEAVLTPACAIELATVSRDRTAASQLVAFVKVELDREDQLGDEEVCRALAVTATWLSTSGHSEAAVLLHRLAHHAEPRVRSSAVESLGKLLMRSRLGVGNEAERQREPERETERNLSSLANDHVLVDEGQLTTHGLKPTALNVLPTALADAAMSAVDVSLTGDARTILGALNDEHHRVRSTAARLLLTLCEVKSQRSWGTSASASLMNMLRDPRVMHKRAALWAITRSAPVLPRPDEFIDPCAQLVDVQGPIGPAARIAAERLTDELRRRWSLRGERVIAG